jgi:hypothetical protein
MTRKRYRVEIQNNVSVATLFDNVVNSFGIAPLDGVRLQVAERYTQFKDLGIKLHTRFRGDYTCHWLRGDFASESDYLLFVMKWSDNDNS